MSEWLQEHAWKACVRQAVPWVRITRSPPTPLCGFGWSDWSSRLSHASLTLGATQHESHSLSADFASLVSLSFVSSRRDLPLLVRVEPAAALQSQSSFAVGAQSWYAPRPVR